MPLRLKLVEVAAFARQQKGPGERGEVLVPVQLPDDLVVAHRIEIEEGDAEPGRVRCSAAVDRVEMPVDFAAEIESLVAEQVEAARADLFGLTDDAPGLFGQPRAEALDERGHVGGIEEKPAGRLRLARERLLERDPAEPRARRVRMFVYLLREADADLMRAHPRHAGQHLPHTTRGRHLLSG